MSVIVYVEGGGDKDYTKKRCRQAFGEFFENAGISSGLSVIAGGGREDTLRGFSREINRTRADEFVVLLVDSEGHVRSGVGAWTHLKDQVPRIRDWFPGMPSDDRAYLMIQCMEAWFLTDKDALEQYFGNGFVRNALPANPDIEEIPKNDVLNGLRDATRQCTGKGRKGQYSKGQHSFEILGRIDPSRVMQASPEARRLIETLKEKVEN